MAGNEDVLGKAKLNPNGPTVADAKVDLNSELILLQPETAELVVVPKEKAKAFLEEANKMEKLCHDLASTREDVLGLEEKIAEVSAGRLPNPVTLEGLNWQLGIAKKRYEAAYQEVKKELGDGNYLTDDDDAGSGKWLLELVPLATRKTGAGPEPWGRKWTYVRSDKVKNHLRSYKLNQAERNQPGSFIKDGKIDLPALKEQISTLAVNLKIWDASKQGFLWPNLQAWAEAINRTASPDKPFQAGWKVHLLRYFAGCGLAGQWEPKAGKLVGKFNGKAEFMLAYGELTSGTFLPNAEGLAWSLIGPKSQKEYVIGCLRFAGEFKLAGAAGASLAGELSLGVDYSGLLPKARGRRRPKNASADQKKVLLDTLDVGGDLGGEAFAGVKAGVDLSGALQFRNPEKNSEFQDLAKIGPKVEGQFGAGAAAHFMVHFEKGKFRMRAKLGLCWGLGAKGELSLEVDAGQIINFLEWLFHALMNVNFEYLEIISTEAFERATQLQVMLANEIAQGVKKIEEIYRDTYNNLEKNWQDFADQLERENRRVALMNHVLKNPPELRFCTPEAHGVLLYELTRYGKLTYMDFDNTGWNFETFGERKKAVLCVCQWAQSKRQLENMIQHIGPAGVERKGSFKGNFAGLKRFMEIGPLDSDYDDKLQVLYNSLPQEPDRGYGVKVATPQKLYFGNSPIYQAMMRGRGWRGS
jgi:hypothetical protein